MNGDSRETRSHFTWDVTDAVRASVRSFTLIIDTTPKLAYQI